jgi:uncharacterized protein
MNDATEPATPVPTRIVLSPMERRVIGTLIEKGLTNPQYYPLTLNHLETGCNQKNNREPLSNYAEHELEACCRKLMERGLVTHHYPSSGRVGRWRQELGRVFTLNAVELAVIGELLLRGTQTEGELRQRASRMREIATLEDLDAILAKLAQNAPRFVVRLTQEGVQRGVRWTHGCYPDDELAALIEAERAGVPATAPRREERAPPPDVVASLEARIAALEARVSALEQK